MNKVVTIVLIGLLWTTGHAQAKSNREEDRLSGSVQTVTSEVAEFVLKEGKNVEGPRVRLHEISYDARGNRVKRVDFSRDGSAAQTVVYNYDSEGRHTGYEDYASGLSTPRKHVYLLDQQGNRAEYKIVQPNGSAADERYVYKYDANGKKVAEELYHKTSLISRNENSYDNQGRLISQTSYNPDGSVSARIRVSLAADGKPLERIRHDGELMTYRVRYTYDAKGKLTEVETTGSYVETDPNSEGHITGKVIYVYKGKEQPKEMLIHNTDGSLRERVLFSYDSRGNWTKKTTLTGKELPRQIEYRTIIYY